MESLGELCTLTHFEFGPSLIHFVVFQRACHIIFPRVVATCAWLCVFVCVPRPCMME
jgi:hypothetical protein